MTMQHIPILTGHAAHLARLAITWRRLFGRTNHPDDLANARRVMGLALGGAR